LITFYKASHRESTKLRGSLSGCYALPGEHYERALSLSRNGNFVTPDERSVAGGRGRPVRRSCSTPSPHTPPVRLTFGPNEVGLRSIRDYADEVMTSQIFRKKKELANHGVGWGAVSFFFPLILQGLRVPWSRLINLTRGDKHRWDSRGRSWFGRGTRLENLRVDECSSAPKYGKLVLAVSSLGNDGIRLRRGSLRFSKPGAMGEPFGGGLGGDGRVLYLPPYWGLFPEATGNVVFFDGP